MDAYSLKPEELGDLAIERLGPATIESPLIKKGVHFVNLRLKGID